MKYWELFQRVLLVAFCIIWFMSGAGQRLYAQGTLESKKDSDTLFDQFKEDRFQELSDQDRMKRAFDDKKARYQSLLTKKSPIFFKSDRQEIIEADRIYILTGNVSIWKDDFKVEADRVVIEQFTGELKATGNVKLHFGKDLLTGDDSSYNLDTGKGWITNARAAVEPNIFMEGDLLEKLPDYDPTGEPQYALHKGFVTSCSGQAPDWRVRARYAVIRLDNYAHMNRSSFWISRLPVFYMPYWYYPTKSGRATGLLIPEVSWSNRRGMIISEDFFWVMNDYMDLTLGGTYFSRIGSSQKLEYRNAFDNYSKGKLLVEHLKEEETPSEDRNPQERWKARYEQTYLLPWDLRVTANLDLRSDQYYHQDYGYELEQEADRFMDNRVSVSRYWNLSHLTMDATYEKDFDRFRDETVQHIPRLEYGSGQQTLFGWLKGSVTTTFESLFREGKAITTMPTESGSLIVEDWLKRDALRGDIRPELRLDIKEFAWFSCTPWVSLRETWWNESKMLDMDHLYGTWATYPNPLPEPENKLLAGISRNGDWLRREYYSVGLEWTGPRIYRIFPMVGYSTVAKLKHVIEPKIAIEVIPEVMQDEIIEFDYNDRVLPGRIVTYSLTNRLLAKLNPRKSKEEEESSGETDSESDKKSEKDGKGKRSQKNASSDGKKEEAKSDPTVLNMGFSSKTGSAQPDGTRTEDAPAMERGEIREFAWITISQSYDLLKAQKWQTEDQDPLLENQTLRDLYPFSNFRLEATVNPFTNIYFSGRMEADPYYHGFSNGYLYGYTKAETWKFGVRWDYARNFEYPLLDWHSMALEGGMMIGERFGVAAWVKYDFEDEIFPYVNLDLTYISQCWAVTLHSFYTEDMEGFGIPSDPFRVSREIQFGLTISLKNIQSVGPRKFGRFWWGDE